MSSNDDLCSIRQLKGYTKANCNFYYDNHCGQIMISQLYHVFYYYSVASQLQPGLCEQPIIYNGEACFSELGYWQQCFSQQASIDIYLPSNIDPEQAEKKAMSFFGGLPFLSPSPECVTDLNPFLCLYLFGSCDSNNQSHQVTQADCERLRDDVCAREWAQAERILGEGVLPQCSDFASQEEESCLASKVVVRTDHGERRPRGMKEWVDSHFH